MSRSLFNVIKPLVAFVLGGPGSGKGTQCKMICEEFGFKHLSAGDLLRAERNSPGSKYGQLIEHHIQEGTIVPVEVTCSLLEKAMMEDETGKYLIDGFPRNQDNLQGWQKQLGDKVNVIFVIFLDCPQDVCVERCLGRGQGRSDDNEVSLRKRLVTYENDTVPIINHYRELNLLKRVDATKPPSEVYSELKKYFADLKL